MKPKMDLARIGRSPIFIIVTFFLLINIFFIITAFNSFFQIDNFFYVLKQTAMIIIVASAATILMMTGNFDLSTGSVVAFTGCVYALLIKNGMALLPAGLLAVVVGIVIGIANGTMVTRLNFPPFIATLCMMYIARGVALILANGATIRDNMPPEIGYLASRDFLGLPIFVVFIIIALAIFVFIQKKTLLGKYALAIGGNKAAAFFSGISTGAIVSAIYIIIGGLAGFAGVMSASRLSAGDPRGMVGFEFDVILAIILGGTGLSGGKGSVIGTFFGALVVASLGNSLDMLNVLTFWQSILKGIIFVLAIVLNEKILKNIGKSGATEAKAWSAPHLSGGLRPKN
jgi:ribose/xylose/arabinose/galactoside ABC-type transport system permease subunit